MIYMNEKMSPDDVLSEKGSRGSSSMPSTPVERISG
jgi:hypothetical protein